MRLNKKNTSTRFQLKLWIMRHFNTLSYNALNPDAVDHIIPVATEFTPDVLQRAIVNVRAGVKLLGTGDELCHFLTLL